MEPWPIPGLEPPPPDKADLSAKQKKLAASTNLRWTVNDSRLLHIIISCSVKRYENWHDFMHGTYYEKRSNILQLPDSRQKCQNPCKIQNRDRIQNNLLLIHNACTCFITTIYEPCVRSGSSINTFYHVWNDLSSKQERNFYTWSRI